MVGACGGGSITVTVMVILINIFIVPSKLEWRLRSGIAFGMFLVRISATTLSIMSGVCEVFFSRST